MSLGRLKMDSSLEALIDGLRLILTGLLEHTNDKNHSDQGENTDESISVGTVKV